MRDEITDDELRPLICRCEDPAELDKVWTEAKAEYDRLLSLFQGQPENVISIHQFGARMAAWGFVKGTQWGYRFRKRQPGNTIVSKILKPITVVTLLLKTPIVTTLEICTVLDSKDIALPWPELRKKSRLWKECASEPKVKMAIRRARQEAKQDISDIRWLRLINNAGDGGLFDKLGSKKRRKQEGD